MVTVDARQISDTLGLGTALLARLLGISTNAVSEKRSGRTPWSRRDLHALRLAYELEQRELGTVRRLLAEWAAEERRS